MGLVALLIGWLVLGCLPSRGDTASLDPGTALQFNGTGAQQVEVPSSAGLNSFPLTITAWIKTSRVAPAYDGIVSKYAAGSNNGYSLHLYQGRVRAWYFRDNTNFVYAGDPGIDGGFVADGKWHHVALVVDGNGAMIYIDGVLGGQQGWTNAAGAPTTAAPLQIGRYSFFGTGFLGEIDEVSVWSVAKTATEVRELRRNPPVGNEAGLQAYWKFDDGAGATLTDCTANLRHGNVIGAPAWVDSTVIFGSRIDVGIPGIGDAGMSQDIIVSDATNPDPGYNREGVQASASLQFTRPAGGPTETINFQAAFRLLDSGGQALPLQGGGTELVLPLPILFGAAGGSTFQFNFPAAKLTPAAQLDPSALVRIELIVRRAEPGTPGSYLEQARRNNDGFAYWHFINTVSPDASDNLLGRVDAVLIPQRVVIGSQLLTEVNLTLRRYDDFMEPAPTEKEFEFTLTPLLIDVTNGGAQIPLSLPPATILASLETFAEDEVRQPTEVNLQTELNIKPAVNLPPGHTFRIDLDVTWTDGDGSMEFFSGSTDSGPLVALSGRLFFGGIETTYTILNEPPYDDGLGNTVLDVASGFVTGFPNHSFSGPVTVAIDPVTLDATVIGGAVNVLGPMPDVGTAAGVRIERGTITLGPDGGTAPMTVWFPAGFGVATPTNFDPDPAVALWPKASVGIQSLDAALGPVTPTISLDATKVRSANLPPLGVDEALTGELFCSHEKLACWVPATTISWDTAAGTFTLPPGGVEWVRSDEMADLPPGDPNHPSNDQFLAGADGSSGLPVVISTTEQGVAQLNATVTLVGADVRAHMPGGASYSYTSGQMVFFENALDPSQSSLDGVAGVALEYSRNCPDAAGVSCPDTTAPPAALTQTPDSGSLLFTVDGGLVANGFITPGELEFGTVDQNGPGGTHRFAHTANGFTAAVYEQAGVALDGAVASPRNDDRPGVLLLSGHQSFADPSLIERPGGPGYADGLETDGQANYPGLNFRVSEELTGPTGSALISGQPIGPFPLTVRSKYYARSSGVSGIHERVTTGTPLNLTLYGFPATLDYFKLSYLSNENKDSVCDGGLIVPFPSDFQQEFLDLHFSCRGQPTTARLPTGGNNHELEYWGRADFETLSLGFTAPRPRLACPAPPQDKGVLVMGVRLTDLPLIATPQQPLLGTLAFKSDGSLVTKSDQNVNGVAEGTALDSRLDLPGGMKISPPSGGSYAFTPTTKGYFNAPPSGTPDGTTNGFLSFAGRLALPFFEEAKVHLHVLPGPGVGEDPVYVMGGWPEGDKPGLGDGWGDAQGRTFFTHPEVFDAAHRGYPDNVAVNVYRDGPGASYHPRARKVWLDLVRFDYPLVWNPVLKNFSSTAVAPVDLLVMDIDHQLKFLNATGAEIAFGGEASFSTPNAQQLIIGVGDALAGGFFSKLDQQIQDGLVGLGNSAADATKLTDAANALDRLLGDKLSAIADAPLDAALANVIDPVVDSLYPAGQQATALVTDLRDGLCGNGGVLDTRNLTEDLMNGAPGVDGLRKDVRDALLEARDGATSLRDIVKRYPEAGNRRQILTRIIDLISRELIGASGLGAELINAAGGLLNDQDFIQELENQPVFDDIEREANALIAQLDEAIAQIDGNTGLGAELNQVVSDGATIVDSIKLAVCQVLDLTAAQGANLAEHSPEMLKRDIKLAIKDRIYSSLVPERLQFIFRARLGSDRGLFRQLLDDTIAQLASTAREAIFEAATQLGQDLPGLGGAVQFSDFPSGSMEATVKGYGRIVGNSMAEVRVDGRLKLGLPDKSGLDFEGFVLVRDLHVTGPNPDCTQIGGTPGAKSEVTMGAKLGVKSRGGGFANGIALSMEAQMAFDNAGSMLGFMGKIGLMLEEGQEIGGASLREASLQLAWTPAANNRYLAAVLDGQVEGIGAKVKLFAGQTCDISRLGVLDIYTQGALKELANFSNPADVNNVAGVFISADGQFPLEKLLGLPAGNPFLSIIAKGGQSWLTVLRNGQPSVLCVGYRQSLGIEGTVLVFIEFSGEIGFAGVACLDFNQFVKLPPDLDAFEAALYGRAEFCVSLLVFKGCAGLEVTGRIKGTDITISGASF